MTRLRTFVVAATIIGSITGSLAALAVDHLLWPFPHYPMFSIVFGPTTTITRAAGVASDGRESPLPKAIEPTGVLLHVIAGDALRRPDASARLTRIATAMWAEYERRRSAGELVGPPLTLVRLYRDTIRLATTPHVRATTLIGQGPP